MIVFAKSLRRSWILPLILALLGLAAGCRTTNRAREQADREVYDIIRGKQGEAGSEARPFSIDTRYSKRSPAEVPAAEIILDRQAAGATAVNLEQALDLAIRQNREYQTRKESLYLAALSLSDTRHQYDFLFEHSTTLERRRPEEHEHTSSANSQLSVGKLLESGASLGLTLANDLLIYTTGSPRRSATSAISVSLVQPLLRGAGSKVAAEGLKQAERNVIYEVRSFSRYQQTFAVDVASRYYRLAQIKDTIYNEYSNYQNLVRSRERSEALARDRLPAFQVDQTRQDELRARNRYLDAVASYFTDLDEFKKLLGLPLDCELRIDDSSLTKLTEKGLRPVRATTEQAFKTALAKRLDLLNEIDRFDDSKRKVKVAADAMAVDVEFVADAWLPSRDDNRWDRFNFRDWTGGAGVRIKLPLDRLNERNGLRRELISFERKLRDLGLAVDNVKTEIRTVMRSLEQARQSYQIQKLSVELAARRVESANLLVQAGRAETRDLLDAQSALLAAQNALTRNLVDYHLARLRLLRDTGLLELEEGRIVELAEPAAPATDDKPDEDLRSPQEIFGTEDKR